jgi:acyl-CoA synthetase (AMP-forming)/AMP-acid ligase II
MEGWLYTGDTGYIDGDGRLFLHSRSEDLIKTSSFQVLRREIEEAMMRPVAEKISRAAAEYIK